ncbi:polysaccharide deacetylase family protein [Arvimicrobium flavum]|uniref:polysaccharide deacetylase family protein n=1 Tax=Arvimicrobium flavum TaxID=3393320 RepID=UPI00237A2689|nr:polysaccharide deacetylase family protein [Mesorhizobium shangrilense]
MDVRSRVADPVTVVMYHYVRPLVRSRYPDIKGLEAELFREQIRYLKANYTIVSMGDFLSARDAGEALPPRACLLTFDDGYSDHYAYAFPIMMDEGVTGAFYAPRSVVLARQVLEVNKTHFILASEPDKAKLETELDRLVEGARDRFDLPTTDALKAEFRQANRFDPAEVIYVKRLLQHALPDALRSEIAAELFARYVSADEKAFAEELYISIEQGRVMAACGMHFGGHGDRHLWHSRLDEAGQRAEIDGADELLDLIGVPSAGRTYCYPYGDYNETTLALLEERGYRAAFTAKVGLADRASEAPYRLSRLDTNDLPKQADAEPNGWTRLAAGAHPQAIAGKI